MICQYLGVSTPCECEAIWRYVDIEHGAAIHLCAKHSKPYEAPKTVQRKAYLETINRPGGG